MGLELQYSLICCNKREHIVWAQLLSL